MKGRRHSRSTGNHATATTAAAISLLLLLPPIALLADPVLCSCSDGCTMLQPASAGRCCCSSCQCGPAPSSEPGPAGPASAAALSAGCAGSSTACHDVHLVFKPEKLQPVPQQKDVSCFVPACNCATGIVPAGRQPARDAGAAGPVPAELRLLKSVRLLM
jgi:hypothetical protein